MKLNITLNTTVPPVFQTMMLEMDFHATTVQELHDLCIRKSGCHAEAFDLCEFCVLLSSRANHHVYPSDTLARVGMKDNDRINVLLF